MSTNPFSLSGLDSAIGTFEGFGDPNSLATVNNNPGNIKAGAFATSHGAVGSNNGFAVFPSTQSGWDALDSLLSVYAKQGLNVAQGITKWNGGGSNSGDYVNYVSDLTGIDPSTQLSSVGQSSTSTPSVAQSIGAASQIMGAALNSFHIGGSPGSTTNGITSPISTTANGVASVQSAFGWWKNLSLNQVVTVFVGLGMLFAGFFMFKGTQDIIVNTTSAAKKVAAFAA